jgi:hypothetical protein
MGISDWFFGIKYLITLTIILIILWACLFTWFSIEENKYGDDVVDKSGFLRSYYEVDENNTNKKKYYSNAFADSIYYTSTMFGTFGYGDIYPRSNAAKGFITFWHFIIIIFVMNLYENMFVSNKTIKDLSLDLLKLKLTYKNQKNDLSESYTPLGP